MDESRENLKHFACGKIILYSVASMLSVFDRDNFKGTPSVLFPLFCYFIWQKRYHSERFTLIIGIKLNFIKLV